jgi:gliding motility-associated-like protein
MRKLLVFVFVCIGLYSNSQVANPPVICGGSSSTLQAGNPQNLTGPTYSMQPGPFTSTAGVFVVTPASTQSFTLYTSGLNSSNVFTTTSAVVTVTVLPQPVISPSFTQATCTNSNSSFNLNLTWAPPSPVPGYTVAWTTTPTGVVSPTQFSATAVVPGVYGTTITAAGGCTLETQFTITPQPLPATFSIVPFGTTYSITCAQTSINLHVTNQNFTYTWSSVSSPNQNTYSVTLNASNVGAWNVFALNPNSGCTETHTFVLAQNTVAPSGTVTPLTQNITCSLSSLATVSVYANPTVNITHYIYDPQGGVFPANTPTAIYYPGGVGTFTHCVTDDANGCISCSNFTVSSTQGFPSYNVVSPISNFTLGCGVKATATIDIINAQTNPIAGGPISYTIIGPPTSTALQSPTLSILSTYTVNVPGTWTVIVRDNNNQCDTRTPISILQNTFAPALSATVPTQVLSCATPSIILYGSSETPNVGYQWNFVGNPGSVVNSSIAVNIATIVPTPSLLNTYTLVVTDNGNTCITTSIIPIFQNLFPPKVSVTNGGTNAIDCLTNTITLTNNSSSGIPSNTLFPVTLPVVGWLWMGPTPQDPLSQSSSYVAGVPGVYTLQAKDLNNGCLGTGTVNIGDNRDYPTVTSPSVPALIDCGALQATVSINVISVNPVSALTSSWTPPNGSTISITPSVNVIYGNLAGIYSVTIHDNTNGCSASGTVSLKNSTVTAAFEADKTEGFAPLTVNFFNNSITSSGSKSITTLWNITNGTSFSTPHATVPASATFSQAGTYTVIIYASKGMCLDSDTLLINVEIPSHVIIPNIFTPNGDHINDLFFVKMSSLHEVSAIIYDRWGRKVYELINSTGGNIEWDGKDQYGKDVAEGTYFYVIKGSGKDGTAYDKHGNVTLVR